MYYSGLYKVIRDLEEKKFYDIALLFLSSKGYPNLVIVDGTGDGGRDVTSSWEHIRIQLSVRRDWDKKINHEAKLALDKGAKSFIYVTNRRIKDHERDQFLQNGFQYKGRVEITIFDLAAISTLLSLPGISNSVNQTLGLPITGKIQATPKEIAISNTLLFSSEAKELRDEVLENCICAHIFAEEGISESILSERVSKDLGNLALNVQAITAINRLRSKGGIKYQAGGFRLSTNVKDRIKLSRDDFERARTKDLDDLAKNFNLNQSDAKSLVRISLEILARKETFNGDAPYSYQTRLK